MNLESDYFESKVDVAVSSSCFSRVSKLAALASKNVSWVFNEMEMLFSVLGVGFFSSSKFGVLREEQGKHIINLAEEVVNENLEREIALVQSGKGLSQGIVNHKEGLPAYTQDQIEHMTSTELGAVLDELGFPKLSKVAERRSALHHLLFETDEEKLKAFAEKYGDVIMWRLDVAGDGSWAYRSYNNNAKSPFGQAALIGACTKSVICWGYRIMKCYLCSRAESLRSVPKAHTCEINHAGTVKSMESEIILECFQKLLLKHCIVAQIALDGDAKTILLLQKMLLEDPASTLSVDVTLGTNSLLLQTMPIEDPRTGCMVER